MPETNPLPDFLLELELLDSAGRRDAIAEQITATGGTYVTPEPNNSWSSQLFEISLFGVSAIGPTKNEAAANWVKAARRLTKESAPA